MSIIFSVIVAVMLYLIAFLATDLKNRSKIFQIILLAEVILIVMTRFYQFWTTMGLDLDEALGGYNAWSILNYGVDQQLNHLPIYLYSWGSGMNALYPYITIPFIKFLGLSVFSYRLPMVLISVTGAFYFLYALIRSKFSNWRIIVLMGIIFLSPALMTSSRWAVESNLFPQLMVLSSASFLLFLIQTGIKRTLMFILFNFLTAISAYCYSSNWIFLATSTVLIYGWLYVSKKVRLKLLVVGALIIVLIVWPLIIFMYVNYVSHHQLSIFGLTITKLAVSRGASQFVFGDGPLLSAICKNIINSTTILVSGYDGLTKIDLPLFGPFYPFFLIFAFIGILRKVQRKFSSFDWYMLLLLISSIPTFLIIHPNYTHLNAIFIPILYFGCIGIMSIFNTKMLRIAFVFFFSVMFIAFCRSYLVTNAPTLKNGGNEISSDFERALKFNNKLGYSNTTIASSYVTTYPFVLFYTHPSPHYFYETRQKLPSSEFMYFSYYGKYRFVQRTHYLKANNHRTYIVQNNVGIDTSSINKFNHKQMGTYTVYYP